MFIPKATHFDSLDQESEGPILYLGFRPRTGRRTFLQCFAFYSCCSKAKHCKNVLGRVLGQKKLDTNPSLIHISRTKDV